jgi:hypothetical protein
MKNINLSLFYTFIFGCNLLSINCQENNNTVTPTKRLRDELIDSYFQPEYRDHIRQKVENNIIWENRLQQALDNVKKDKFRKELLVCDQVIGLRQFICPICKPLVGDAVMRGRTDAIEAMIEYEFDPNMGFFGVTPLNIALKKLDFKSFMILLNSPKIDVNKIDLGGFSPLNIAIILKNETMVSLLLDHGATLIDPKTSIFNIDLNACKKITPEIKLIIHDYAMRNKIARTPYERWLEKQ